MLLPCNPQIALLGIYAKVLQTYFLTHNKTCTWTFIAALLIIVKTWKQWRYPSEVEWINNLIHTNNGILFVTKNNLSRHEKPWWSHKCILLTEGSQFEEAAYSVTPTSWHSGKGKTEDIVKISVVAKVSQVLIFSLVHIAPPAIHQLEYSFSSVALVHCHLHSWVSSLVSLVFMVCLFVSPVFGAMNCLVSSCSLDLEKLFISQSV